MVLGSFERLCRPMCGRALTFRGVGLIFGATPMDLEADEGPTIGDAAHAQRRGIAPTEHVRFRKVRDLPHIGRHSRWRNDGSLPTSHLWSHRRYEQDQSPL